MHSLSVITVFAKLQRLFGTRNCDGEMVGAFLAYSPTLGLFFQAGALQGDAVTPPAEKQVPFHLRGLYSLQDVNVPYLSICLQSSVEW